MFPKLRFAFLIGLVLATNSAVRAQPGAQIGFDDNGLSSIQLDGQELLAAGQPRVSYLKQRAADGTLGDVNSNTAPTTFDVAAKELQQQFSWGQIITDYRVAPQGLDIEVTVKNQGALPLDKLGIGLMKIQFPATPQGRVWQKGDGINSENTDGIALISASWEGGSLALLARNSEPPLALSWSPLKPTPKLYEVRFGPQARTARDFVHQDDIAILPQTSQKFRFSLRLGETDASLQKLAGEVYADFAAQTPPTLNWDDRRAIGMLFYASSNLGAPLNPRGWFNDKTADFTSEAGRAAFQTQMLAAADRSIAILKQMDAQGMILWDLEGEEFPHATTYIGDPRALPQWAPEMDAVADELFAKFRDAGFKVGLTIRPSQIAENTDPNAKIRVRHNHMNFDPVEEMSQKIDYAQKRWNCTLFYLDSNATYAFTPDLDKNGKPQVTAWTMRAAMLQRLAAKHPDVLIIPEHSYLGYYGATAPYGELAAGTTQTSPQVRLAYPNAFTVIKAGDLPGIKAHHDDLVAGVKSGDILLFRGWFNDGANAEIKSIYDEAKAQ